jgi:TonB family protein
VIVLRIFLALHAAMWAAVDTVPVQLQPNGPWKVIYADDGCVLGRPFTGAGAIYDFALTFEPVNPKAWLRIHSDENLGGRHDGDADVTVDGSPLSHTVHFNVFPGKVGGTVREFLFSDFHKEAAHAQRSIGLNAGRFGDLQIDAPDFAKAMESMKSCLDDLHRSLGIDPALLTTIASPPGGFSATFVDTPRERKFDYKILYWVDEKGRVNECHLLGSSGNEEFDKKACDQLRKNGKFTPARDVAGNAVRAPVYEDVNLITTVVRSN